jgi:hypothetical protein
MRRSEVTLTRGRRDCGQRVVKKGSVRKIVVFLYADRRVLTDILSLLWVHLIRLALI